MIGWERTGQLWSRTVRATDVAGPDVLPVQLTSPPQGALPTAWTQLVQWQAPEGVAPQPVVLNVEVSGIPSGSPAAEGPAATPDVEAFGGSVRAAPPGWGEWLRRGMLLVEYAGYGGSSRRWMDPRTGAYALPPSRLVTVSARAYRDDQAEWAPWRLTVGLAPGELQSPAQPVYSGVAVATEDDARFWWPPAGARDVRLALDPGAASDAVVNIRGTQPGQQMGPLAWDQYAPPADLAPIAASCPVEWTASAGSALVVVETGLQW